MKIYIIITLIISSLFISCKVYKAEKSDFAGMFYADAIENGFNHQYKLELKNDSTFSLSIKVKGATPKCDGKWELSSNILYLTCEENENPYEMLTSGYMNQREFTLKIINKNEIKLDEMILNRID